jgi:hypothetical protein
VTGFKPAVVQQIGQRDNGACALCGKRVWGDRGRDWSVHHRQPRGMGGGKRPHVNGTANGLLLHGHGASQCHGWVESHRELARARGLIVLHGKHLPADVPVLHAAHDSWVLLDDDGGFTRIEQPEGF